MKHAVIQEGAEVELQMIHRAHFIWSVAVLFVVISCFLRSVASELVFSATLCALQCCGIKRVASNRQSLIHVSVITISGRASEKDPPAAWEKVRLDDCGTDKMKASPFIGPRSDDAQAILLSFLLCRCNDLISALPGQITLCPSDSGSQEDRV